MEELPPSTAQLTLQECLFLSPYDLQNDQLLIKDYTKSRLHSAEHCLPHPDGYSEFLLKNGL